MFIQSDKPWLVAQVQWEVFHLKISNVMLLFFLETYVTSFKLMEVILSGLVLFIA
jgi:hypothetical protein